MGDNVDFANAAAEAKAMLAGVRQGQEEPLTVATKFDSGNNARKQIERAQELEALRQGLPTEKREAVAGIYAQGPSREEAQARARTIGGLYDAKLAAVNEQLGALSPVSKQDRRNALRDSVIPRQTLDPKTVFLHNGLGEVQIKLPENANPWIEPIDELRVAGEPARYRVVIEPRDMSESTNSKDKTAAFKPLSIELTAKQLKEFVVPNGGYNRFAVMRDHGTSKPNLGSDLKFKIVSADPKSPNPKVATYGKELAPHVLPDSDASPIEEPKHELSEEGKELLATRKEALLEKRTQAREVRAAEHQVRLDGIYAKGNYDIDQAFGGNRSGNHSIHPTHRSGGHGGHHRRPSRRR